MSYRIRNLALAFGLAGLAAVLTTVYVVNYKRTVQGDEQDVSVFVAAKDIPAGTTGAKAIAAGLLEKAEIPRRSVVPGAISKPEEIDDLVATGSVYAGEQISVRRFAPAEEGGPRSALEGNVRAVQVPGQPSQILVGTLKKGDRVDVVGNFSVRFKDDDREHTYTRTVLRDLLVLRASGTPVEGEKVARTTGKHSVQLAMTDTQAQKFFFTMRNGDWHLTLRSVTDATDSPESLEDVESVLCDGLRRAHQSVCFEGSR